MIGYHYLRQEKFDYASSVFDLYIENHPNDNMALIAKADCYLGQKDTLNALKYFQSAEQIKTNEHTAYQLEILTK